MKTNSSPDSLPEFKYPFLSNVRNYSESSATSRPQLVQSQAAPGGGNNGAVLTLEPTLGVYKIGTKIFNAGNVIDTGYTDGQGCSIVPFRPNASPNAYDYVFDDAKASKVFVPTSGSPVVTKVGIAEPQSAPDVSKDTLSVDGPGILAAGWTNGGTAGAISDGTRTTDTVGQVFVDPAYSIHYSLQVGTSQYQAGQLISIGGNQNIVEDVYPAIAIAVPLSILSIFYFSGNTGHCVIVPSTMPIDNAIPTFSEGDPVGATLASQSLISTLRRGSLIKLGGTEIVFVWSVSRGPSNSICIETSTVNNHAAAEAIIGIPAIGVHAGPVPVAGQAISSVLISWTNAVGTGTITTTFAAANNPFIHQNVVGVDTPAPQQDDYIHVSFNVADLTLLSTTLPAIRISFDVNNGAADFTSNFYYFDVRTADLQAAVSNATTQLGAAQLAAQRQVIDNQLSDISLIRGNLNPEFSRNIPDTSPAIPINSSDQTSLGTAQWTEIMFPITALTRVGNDESRSLANCQAMQIQVITTNNDVIEVSSIWVSNGGALPDVGDFGGLYFYRVRPRASTTGARGNPSPSSRYGVNPRRQRVIVNLPSASYDSQIDTWDVFRFGGQINSWRYVGSAASSASTFTDNFFDDSVANAELLDFGNFEPFPSIGPPITASSSTIVGTTMQATFPLASQSPAGFGTLSQLGALLPGNVFNVGAQVFTLFIRPTLVSTTPTTQTYLFQFVENAGSQTNPIVILQEPNVAAQGTNNVFGPDTNGVLFAVMAGTANNGGVNGLRAGLIQWTNPNNPDGASDTNTADLCPPSEPLQNGVLIGPTPCVASTKRWWRGFPQANGTYAWNEIPVGRGLAAQFGICTDGQYAYFIATDGICRHAGGGRESLTDPDLYNLFPHEGIFPQNVTYAGQTVFSPEYKYAANMRLSVVNGYLYFDYLDSTATQRTLVCDLRKIAWSVDVYSNVISIHAGTASPASNQLVPASAVRNQQLFMGDTTGALYSEQSSPVAGVGESVACVVITREEVLGDIRANKMFGDAAIDLLPAASVTVTPIFFSTLFGTSTIISGGATSRPLSPPTINLSGQQLNRSMGLSLSWTDQGTNTTLFMWQVSYFTQPEDISNRITDWDNAGVVGNKFIQGFEIEADSANVLKNLAVRDGDNLLLHDFHSNVGNNQIKANGQQVIPCSFNTPFSAHLVRLEPQDLVVWRLFGIRWVFEPTPESVLNWMTQGTSFGYQGYFHIFKVAAAYVSTAPVTLTLTYFDGNSPTAITLPSTGGQYQKTTFTLSANKGRLCTVQGVSASPWQPFVNDWVMYCKEWGSSGPYQPKALIGGEHGATARI